MGAGKGGDADQESGDSRLARSHKSSSVRAVLRVVSLPIIPPAGAGRRSAAGVAAGSKAPHPAMHQLEAAQQPHRQTEKGIQGHEAGVSKRTHPVPGARTVRGERRRQEEGRPAARRQRVLAVRTIGALLCEGQMLILVLSRGRSLEIGQIRQRFTVNGRAYRLLV